MKKLAVMAFAMLAGAFSLGVAQRPAYADGAIAVTSSQT